MKKLTSLGLLLLLTACATPDLSGFSRESTKLAALTKAELYHMSSAYAEVGKKEQEKSVKASEKVVNASLKAIVGYSDALKSLSESGENGSEAVNIAVGHFDSLHNTLKPLLGDGLGLTSASLNIATSAVKKIGDFVQAQQANQSLRSIVEQAQPAVEGMRDLVLMAFSYCRDQGASPCAPRSIGTPTEPQGQWAQAVTAITDARRLKIEQEFGDDVIAVIKFIQLKRNDLYASYLRELQQSETASPKFCVGEGDCVDPDTIETLARLDERRAALLPELEAYQARIDASKSWQKSRLSNGAVIVDAVQVWVEEHAKVAEALQECRFNVQRCRSVDGTELASVLINGLNAGE
ncbi:hypothetical protein [uncultured Thalassospira sp.]|uniref:hypothetical protein n=1 Tax=uncultured Thalassospira sp. TaxID=404382 RepID=UPI00258DF891|nr:hypothetical protein [uncultured Thalassospira sp.]